MKDRSSSSKCFEDITYSEMLMISYSLNGALASSNYLRKLFSVMASISSEVTAGVSLQLEILSSCKWYGIPFVSRCFNSSKDSSCRSFFRYMIDLKSLNCTKACSNSAISPSSIPQLSNLTRLMFVYRNFAALFSALQWPELSV